MFSKLIGRPPVIKLENKSSPVVQDIEEISDSEDEDEQNKNECYLWCYEWDDLRCVLVLIRKASGIRYNYQLQDGNSKVLEITASTEISEEELHAISSHLQVPKELIIKNFKPWLKISTFKLNNSIESVPEKLLSTNSFILLKFRFQQGPVILD